MKVAFKWTGSKAINDTSGEVELTVGNATYKFPMPSFKHAQAMDIAIQLMVEDAYEAGKSDMAKEIYLHIEEHL